MDAVQTFGKVPIDLDAFDIDMLSFSGHKIYGPKGVAGLYIRKGTKMVSVQHGGEHERRRRAGTENVTGIVGLGRAVEIRGRDMADEAVRLTALRDRLWEGIRGRVPDVRLNGHPTRRVPGTCNICLPARGVGIHRARPGSEGHRRVGRLGVHLGQRGAVVRAGGDGGAGGVGDGRGAACSLGRSTTAEDIDYVVESTVPLVEKLRSVMPVRA